MPSRHHVKLLMGIAALCTLLAAPVVVSADGVDDAQRNVDAVLNQLEDLQNQMGQLDEDYGTAEHRQTQLQTEIAASQVKIDALDNELGGMQTVLQTIALHRFTSGDTLGLSPIFTDAGAYTLALQKSALGLSAIDASETSIDSLQQVADELAAEQEAMRRKRDEAADLLTTLDRKRSEYSELEKTYTEKYAQAKRDLGEAKLKAEEERRAVAAAAKRAAIAQQANSQQPTRGTPRSGGAGSGSPAPTAPSTPASPAPNVPAVSGRAGIAVQAALSQLGVPYKFATAQPGVSFDCSGLTSWAWAQAGVSMPHVSRLQYAALPHVPLDQAQPGDLIFYYSPIGHVGLYLGGGKLVHAPQTGSVVNITTVHWNKVVGVARPG